MPLSIFPLQKGFTASRKAFASSGNAHTIHASTACSDASIGQAHPYHVLHCKTTALTEHLSGLQLLLIVSNTYQCIVSYKNLTLFERIRSYFFHNLTQFFFSCSWIPGFLQIILRFCDPRRNNKTIFCTK